MCNMQDKMTENRKLQVAIAYLRGPAEVWYSTTCLREDLSEWSLFKHALINRFRPRAFGEALQEKLKKIKQQKGERVLDHAERFKALHARYAKMPQINEYMRARIKGLLGDWSLKVALQQPFDFEDAVEAAIVLETANEYVADTREEEIGLQPYEDTRVNNFKDFMSQVSDMAAAAVSKKMQLSDSNRPAPRPPPMPKHQTRWPKPPRQQQAGVNVEPNVISQT